MNIENIIFDVDGTLWDSTGEVAKAWNLAVKELGIECEEITSDTLKRECDCRSFISERKCRGKRTGIGIVLYV